MTRFPGGVLGAVFALQCIIASAAVATSGTTIEYLALVPNSAHAHDTITWLKLEYPEAGPATVSDVAMTPVVESVDVLGAWFNVSLHTGSGAMITAKIHGDNLYAFVNKGIFPVSGGCCADTMRVFPRSGGGKYTDVDLSGPVQEAFGIKNAHPTHTFDLFEVDGEVFAICMVQYPEPALDNAKTDAIFAVSMKDGRALKTADGDKFFKIFQRMGTKSAEYSDSIFKIQFEPGVTGGDGEEWHGNGMLRFEAADGTAILAITERNEASATLMKDPFTYSASEGGGTIVQRFGTPSQYSSKAQHRGTRWFGSPSEELKGGVHNLWHRVKASGEHTLTMFANGPLSDGKSHVFEFNVKVVEQNSTLPEYTSDSVFDTPFTEASFTWSAPAQGGARALSDTVWIGASGMAEYGYQLVDSAGGHKGFKFGKGALYDPFVRVLAVPAKGAEPSAVLV